MNNLPIFNSKNIQSSTPVSTVNPIAFGRRTNLLTCEMQCDIDRALTAIDHYRNVVVLDTTQLRWSAFLSDLMQQCDFADPNVKVICMSMADIHSMGEFKDMWLTSVLRTLTKDKPQMKAYADECLCEYEYDLRSRFYKDGVKHDLIHVCQSTDPNQTGDELFEVGEQICIKEGMRLIIFVRDIDYIERLDQSEEMISMFKKLFRQKNGVTLVTATSSRSLYKSLTTGTKISKCERWRLTPLTKESVRDNIEEHLHLQRSQASEQCLDRLSFLAKTNLTVGLELADLAVRFSGKRLTLEGIEQAFAFMLNSRQRLYERQTASLTQTQRQMLKLLSAGGSFKNPVTLYGFGLPSEQDLIPIKEQLIDAGILIENDKACQLVDPIYQYWIENCYAQAEKVVDLTSC